MPPAGCAQASRWRCRMASRWAGTASIGGRTTRAVGTRSSATVAVERTGPRTLRLSVFHRAFTVLGFSPELVLVHEERETNAQLYDFKRTRGELRLQRLF